MDPAAGIPPLLQSYLLILSQSLNWIVSMTFLGQIINRFVFSKIEESLNIKIPSILRGLVYTILIISASCGIIVYVFHHNITAILTASGLLSLVVGLAIKENLSNVFSGVFLAIDKNIKKGDVLMLDGIKGEVINITWRSTILKTSNGEKIILPNSHIAQSIITNYSVEDDHCFESSMMTYSIFVHPDHDPEYVKRLIQSALDKSQAPYGFPPIKQRQVFFHGLNEKGIEFLIRFNCFKSKTIIYKDIVLHNIHKNLKIAGIRTTAGTLFAHIDPDIGFKALQHTQLEDDDYVQDIDDVMDQNLYHEKLKNEVFLNKVAILNRLPQEVIIDLAKQVNRVVYPKGSQIIKQGEHGSSMFIIVEGAVIIEIESENKIVEVGRLGNADIFGEMSLLTGEQRTANVTSIEQSVVLEIHKEQMKIIFDENPSVLNLVSEVVAARQAFNKSFISDEENASHEVVKIGDVIMSKIKTFFGLP